MKDKERIEILERELKVLKLENQRLRSFLSYLIQSIQEINKISRNRLKLSETTIQDIYKKPNNDFKSVFGDNKE